jgi:hypothetical protein
VAGDREGVVNHLKHIAATLLVGALVGIVTVATGSDLPLLAALVPLLNYVRVLIGRWGGGGPPAYAFLWAVALNGALFAAACATVPPAVVKFGHCTTEALRKAGNTLLARVMTALATGDYAAELTKLAVQFGGDEVGCAVDLAIDMLNGMRAHSNDPVVELMLTRAQAWRGANP